MDEKAFTAGVIPGGLTTNKEIKILLCYIFSVFDLPISRSLVTYILTEEGLVNYFECVDALNDLLDIGNLRLCEDGCTLTDTGRNIAETLFEDIPLSVRERAVATMEDAVRFQKNQQQHRTELKKISDGYIVRCYLPEAANNLFSLELYAPDRRCAQIIERNFIMLGEQLIRSIIEQLTVDLDE